ncbi:MAG: hypothetical protein V3R86_08150 [Candidatus Hydrothermarchaeaceae archaeon]
MPEGTELVTFVLYPWDVRLGSDMPADRVLVAMDADGEDGWTALFDTENLENGDYSIFMGPTYEGAPEENKFISTAVKKVVIEN